MLRVPWYLNIWWHISVVPPAPIHTIYLSLLPPVIPNFPLHHFFTFLPPPLPGRTCETAASLGKWSVRMCACLDCDQVCNVRYGYITLLHRTHHYTPSLTKTHHDTSTHYYTSVHTMTYQYTPQGCHPSGSKKSTLVVRIGQLHVTAL
jgi:hypothetical protein